MEINVFPGRLLIEREQVEQKGLVINPKGRERRRNKGIVLQSKSKDFKEGDDIFFSARRGTLIGTKAIIDINDVILKNMELLGSRLLVETIEIKKVTTGGVIVPDSVKLESQTGYVRALGDEVPFKPGTKELKFKEGDKIFFSEGSGIKIPDDKYNMIILNVRDVYSVL